MARWWRVGAFLILGAGSGVAAIAAAKSGAALVIAAEVDPLALAAIEMNARLNGVAVDTAWGDDLVGQPLPGIDIVLAGDVCYERPMAERLTAWLSGLAGGGMPVLLGDPGRAYLPPRRGLVPLANYRVPTPLELEDRPARDTTVWRMLPH
jgi:predicted nicotinamide N-methyase